MGLIRLDKYLADMQLGTRSEVKNIIKKGKVTIDGVVVKSADVKIDTQKCNVVCDGVTIGYCQTEYFMLNKPKGVLSATMDKKQLTVVDLIKDKSRKDLFPVGRLDKDTEGLLLITNDGELAHNLLSPKKHVDKVYFAVVAGVVDEIIVKEFEKGVVINDEFTALPAKLEVLNTNNQEYDVTASEVLVTIQEGKFHQVKKMFLAVGSEVLYLKRLSMGSLKLDENLKVGEYRHLTNEELQALKKIVS